MPDYEIEAIERSMQDGYFHRDGSQPRKSEVRACIEFFKSIQGSDNEMIIAMRKMVFDRAILISGYDMENQEPRFIANQIKTH